MVELADTSDLGSDELRSWRFESSYPHSTESFYDSVFCRLVRLIKEKDALLDYLSQKRVFVVIS